LKEIDKVELANNELQHLIEEISFDLEATNNVLTKTVNTAKYIHVVNAWEDPMVDETIKKILASNEFVVTPLIAKNKVVGLLMADYAYSGRNITEESIEVLTMFAGSAAITIENAKMISTLEEKIEELQNAYAELKIAQDKLIKNKKLAAMGQVSTRIAHEIRNPLAIIGGFAKSVPKIYKDRNLTIKNANIIVEEVRRLEHTLSNVLDFTRQPIPEKSLTDVNILVKKTLRMFENKVISQGVTVKTNLEKGKLEAEFDSAQIKQVLINVIQNALNAMPKGGVLEIKSSVCDNKLCLDISDTGKGIPNHYLERIFEPFFTTRSSGAGLGLTISHGIIQNHNGNISIFSEEKKGTIVSILIPIE